MNRSLIALALCAALAAAGPAVAQTSAKFDPTRDTAESMQSYVKLLNHSECLLAAGESAEGILTAKPNSRPERTKTGALHSRVKTCPLKGLENIHSLVRGSLAEAMYRRQVRQVPVVDASRAQAFVNGEKAFQSDREQGDQVMASVMSCMVAVSPDKAHALLLTQHGTTEEATAMDAFFAASQKCGAGASRPKNLSRSFIRAFVADSAWRFARTAGQR